MQAKLCYKLGISRPMFDLETLCRCMLRLLQITVKLQRFILLETAFLQFVPCNFMTRATTGGTFSNSYGCMGKHFVKSRRF
jgi:hypothetical protein